MKLLSCMFQILAFIGVVIFCHLVFVWELIFGENKGQKGSVSDWVIAFWSVVGDLVKRK